MEVIEEFLHVTNYLTARVDQLSMERKNRIRKILVQGGGEQVLVHVYYDMYINEFGRLYKLVDKDHLLVRIAVMTLMGSLALS